MSQKKQGNIPRSFIDDLLARTDIVQLINQRVPLKKAGATYKACCPFHNEKTPSFNVNPTKQFYHCFGCGAHGDAIKFLMEYDGLSFVESVEQLAAFNGLEVPREQLTPQQEQKQKQVKDLYDVTYQVTKFYRQQLKNHAASEQAKDYLRNRGLTAEIAKEFVIGFAPPGWESLVPGLKADGAYQKLLVESGMLVEKEDGRKYDRFRNRIMFPIRDGRGRVVAFGGRIIDPQDNPKYLNSPETPIFHKSYTLYGLYEMRQSRQNFDHMLVVEGYMDVVSLAQFGIRNAVATLGTAITVEHLDLLFRQVNRVVFCFDGDEAGKKAAWKALELALPVMTETRSVQFLFLDQGEDPDSTVRKEGVVGFQQRVAQAMTLSAFLFKGLQARLSMPVSTPEGQQQLIALAKPYIVQSQGAMPDLLTAMLSEKVDLPVWRLGQVMGIRVAGNSQKKPKVEVKPTLKPTTQVLKLAAVLLKRPQWISIFSEELLAQMSASTKSENHLLVQIIQAIQYHRHVPGEVENWMLQNGYESVLKQIKTVVLEDDDTFLEKLFEALAMQLVVELKTEKAQQQLAEDDLALKHWYELQKQQKLEKP